MVIIEFRHIPISQSFATLGASCSTQHSHHSLWPRHWTLWVRSRRNGFRGQLQLAKSSAILVVAGKVTKSKVAARICPVAALPTWRKGKSVSAQPNVRLPADIFFSWTETSLIHSWIIWWMWKLPTILGLQLGVKSQKPWRPSPSTPVLYVERRSV